MTPKKFAIGIAAWSLCFLCMAGGGFTALGISACIWGGEVVTGALGNPPNRSHPAFWLFIALLPPCMIIGAAGGIAAIVIPAYSFFRIPMRRKGQAPGWIGRYIKA